MIDFFTYCLISLIYIMVIHFAVGIGNEFKTFILFLIFVIGAALGAYLKSYEFGLGAAFILSLITW